jgi:hypothetical protein
MAETYLLFVGNNRYELDFLRAGRRAALDAGELSMFALVETRRLRLVPPFCARSASVRYGPGCSKDGWNGR